LQVNPLQMRGPADQGGSRQRAQAGNEADPQCQQQNAVHPLPSSAPDFEAVWNFQPEMLPVRSGRNFIQGSDADANQKAKGHSRNYALQKF
jgi:hypothetical protein